MAIDAAATETSGLLKSIKSVPELLPPLQTRSFSSPSLFGANIRDGGGGYIVGKTPGGYGGSESPKFVRLQSSSRTLSFRGGGGTPSGFVNNDNVGIPLEAWIVVALAAALSYALYNISIKKASNDINPVLGGVILQFVAAIMGLCIYFGLHHGGSDGSTDEGSVDYNSTGIMWSVAAGVFVGAAEILSFVVNGKGVPATQSIPVIIGGSVLFGTVLGRLFLGEAVSPKGWAGVTLITIGIAIVSMEEPSGGEGGARKT